jgi:hypothetical protein
MLPPGRARLATRPVPTGSIEFGSTTGMVLVALFTASAAGVVVTMEIEVCPCEPRGELGEPLRAAFGVPALHDEVLPLDVAELTEMLKEALLDPQVGDRDEADPPDLSRVLSLGDDHLDEEAEGHDRSNTV